MASEPVVGVESFSVKITSDLKPLLREWGATTRISPVWQLRPTIVDKGLIEKVKVGKPVSLWFLHGVSAEFIRDEFTQENLAKLYDESIWLSVGTFSIILVCRDEQLDEDLINICADSRVTYERWVVEECDGANNFSGNDIEYDCQDEYSSSLNRRTELASQAFAKASIEADDVLGFMQLELYALLSVVEKRAKGPYSVLARDAMKVEELANDLVNGHDDNDEEGDCLQSNGGVTRPDILLTLNAGLSRLSSQALSGTSPILRTECHFWPHSLLGTGVANLALRNVTFFISSLTKIAKFDQRIYALRDQKFDASAFTIEKPDENFPDFACIKRTEVALANNLSNLTVEQLDAYKEDGGETTTPITYFSGRDGFMNGPLTTSAPLPSVSGANSYQWNLGTITHEISHRVLSGHLVDCLESFLDDMYNLQESGVKDCASVLAYFQTSPSNYARYASRMMGRTLLLMNCLDFDETDMKAAMIRPYDFFIEAIERHSDGIEELLVHIFDFYHFYGQDTENYCSFVWLSWAVQPSIEEKFEEYVIRTLVALSVKYTGRENWKDLAISDFQSVLAQEPLLSRLEIREEVETLLCNEEQLEEIREYLDIAEHLLVLFHMFFKLNSLQVDASEELYSNPENRTVKRNGRKERRYYHYRFSAGSFVSESPSIGRPRFSNPLLFLRDYSREEKPSAAQSAWLLHMLAFNVDWERLEREGAE